MKIKNNVKWVGKVDWELRKFHGNEYSAHKGSTYNSYLIEEAGYFFNYYDHINQTEVSAWITANTSLKVELVEPLQEAYINRIEFRSLLGQLNSNIIMVIIISLLTLLLFGYMQIHERHDEIYTERALGLKLNQLFLLFLIEILIMLIS